MVKPVARASLLFVLIPIAVCRVAYDLRPTQTNFATDQYDFELGWTPMPTSIPKGWGGLSKRQAVYAPNATCGFIDGLSTSVLTCNNLLDCGFNSGFGAAGCCSGYTSANGQYTLTACDFFTACYDSTAVAASCDSSCQSNTHNLLCEQASQPYCVTWSFTDIGYTNLGCLDVSGLTGYLAITYNAPPSNSTTPVGGGGATTTPPTTQGPTTTTTTAARTTTSPSTTIPPVIFTTTKSSTPGTSSTTTTAPTSSSTPPSSSISSAVDTSGISQPTTTTTSSPTDSALNPGGVTTNTGSTGSTAGGTSTSTDTTTAPGSSGTSSGQSGGVSGSSSSNTGAIAGGVVGGVLGLALIGGLIWFLMRRKRNNDNGPPSPEISEKHASSQYPHSPISPNTQGPSQFGSPQQVHEFPAAAAVGAYNHPTQHPQSGYQPGQGYNNQGYSQQADNNQGYESQGYNSQTYNNSQAHEISSEGTGSSRPLNPAYSNAPEVVQQQQPQGGYRGIEPTGGGGYNPNAGQGHDPGFYSRPYSEMP